MRRRNERKRNEPHLRTEKNTIKNSGDTMRWIDERWTYSLAKLPKQSGRHLGPDERDFSVSSRWASEDVSALSAIGPRRRPVRGTARGPWHLKAVGSSHCNDTQNKNMWNVINVIVANYYSVNPIREQRKQIAITLGNLIPSANILIIKLLIISTVLKDAKYLIWNGRTSLKIPHCLGKGKFRGITSCLHPCTCFPFRVRKCFSCKY